LDFEVWAQDLRSKVPTRVSDEGSRSVPVQDFEIVRVGRRRRSDVRRYMVWCFYVSVKWGLSFGGAPELSTFDSSDIEEKRKKKRRRDFNFNNVPKSTSKLLATYI
jgi:hypothetical protein